MFKVEVRETHVVGDRWVWDWRIVSRFGLVKAEGGGCETEAEARADGAVVAQRLQEHHARSIWR